MRLDARMPCTPHALTLDVAGFALTGPTSVHVVAPRDEQMPTLARGLSETASAPMLSGVHCFQMGRVAASPVEAGVTTCTLITRFGSVVAEMIDMLPRLDHTTSQPKRHDVRMGIFTRRPAVAASVTVGSKAAAPRPARIRTSRSVYALCEYIRPERRRPQRIPMLPHPLVVHAAQTLGKPLVVAVVDLAQSHRSHEPQITGLEMTMETLWP